MGWTSDPELAELFRAELTERSEKLVAGARAMADGKAIDPDHAGLMLREGHTIKGTGRVMGFIAISNAGSRLESIWQTVQAGERKSTVELGDALERLSVQLVPAIDADPEAGTPELVSAIRAVDELLSGRKAHGADDGVIPEDFDAPLTPIFDVAEQREAPTPEEFDAALSVDRPVRHLAHSMMASGSDRVAYTPRDEPPLDGVVAAGASDLGGLLGALETWAADDTLTVNAADLYRLINRAAALNIDVDALGADLEADGDWRSAFGVVRALAAELQNAALELAAAPLSEILRPLHQLVGYLGRKTEKQIAFEVSGDDVLVDRQVLERLADPLRQIIVNAVEHGVEPAHLRDAAGKPTTATLTLRATEKDGAVVIELIDDGKGIDWEAVERVGREKGRIEGEAMEPTLRRLIFEGLTTATAESDLAGAADGLPELRRVIESLYGSINLESETGRGTTLTMVVPSSRVLHRALLVRSAGRNWGIPESEVLDVLGRDTVAVRETDEGRVIDYRGESVPLVSLGAALGVAGDVDGDVAGDVVVLASPIGSYAVTVEAVDGYRSVAAKELRPLLRGASHLTGAAMLGGGDVALLIDVDVLVRQDRDPDFGERRRVLVVDDSRSVREVVAGSLAASGWIVDGASGRDEAIAHFGAGSFDAVVLDYAMPDADGVAVAAAIRELDPQVPMVMLSAVADEADKTRALDAGVDVCIDKSDLRHSGLAETLRALIESREGEATS